MKRKRALAAIAAAAVLAASTVSVPVFAEETDQEVSTQQTSGVTSYEKGKSQTVDGDISSNNIGVETYAGTVTVNGDVSGSADGVYATKDGTVTVNGDVSSNGNGVWVSNGASVSVNGDISSRHTGVQVNNDATNEAGNTTVSISGEVSTDVPQPSDPNEYTSGYGVVAVNDGGNINVNVGGDVTSQIDVSKSTPKEGGSSNGYVSGIQSIVGDDDASNKISVDGNVSVEGKGTTYALGVESSTEYSYEDEEGNVYRYSGGSSDVDVSGDVSVSGNRAVGITSDTYDYYQQDAKDGKGSSSGRSSVTAGGDLTVTGNIATGIYSETGKGTTNNVKVDGSVTAQSLQDEVGSPIAIQSVNYEGTAKIETGAVTSDGIGVQVIGNNEKEQEGGTDISIDGDVNASTYGITYYGNITSNVEVDGTVSGDAAAVVLYEGKNDPIALDNKSLTVWKLESSSGDLVKAYDNGYDQSAGKSVREENKETAEAFAKNIDYIIKTDSAENGTLTLSGADQNDKYGYTAKENTKLTINVKAADGYTVDSVSGGAAILTRNADGTYTLVVPRGGGVKVSALIKAIQAQAAASENNGGSAETQESVPVVVEAVAVPGQANVPYIIPKDSSDVVLPDAEVTGSYENVTADVVATISRAEQVNAAADADTTGTALTGVAAQAAALKNYTDAAYPAAEKVYGPYKVQLYSKGVALWDNFGTLKVNIKVDPAYNGKTATIAHLEKDGSVTTAQAVVANGLISVDLTTAGTISVVIE